MHERKVLCGEHGEQQATFVCQHIVMTIRDHVPRGFFWATGDPDNPRPDGVV